MIRRITVVCLLILIAGCGSPALSDNPDSNQTGTEKTKMNSTEAIQTKNNQTSSQVQYNISNESAKERALVSEQMYLKHQLSNATCLDSWGTSSATVTERAVIVNRSRHGIRVSVTHPYWYGEEQNAADSYSEAQYIVTKNNTQRVSGDNVSPC